MSRPSGLLVLLLLGTLVIAQEPPAAPTEAPLPPEPVPVFPQPPPLPPPPLPAEEVILDEGAFEQAVGLAVAFPFSLPYQILKDRLDRKGYFPPFPYAEDIPAYLQFPPPGEEQPIPLRPRGT